MSDKIITFKELNKLTGTYQYESDIPYSQLQCVQYSQLPEFNAELKTDSPSYSTVQLVKYGDIQPTLSSFSKIAVFTYIHNYGGDDLGNGFSKYLYNLNDYVVSGISLPSQNNYNITIVCENPESDWNESQDDVYEYKGLAFVFLCPHTIYSLVDNVDVSAIVKLTSLYYEYDGAEENYGYEIVNVLKLKTTASGVTDILNEINGQSNITDFTHTDEYSSDSTTESYGYVIDFKGIPFDDYTSLYYNIVVGGEILYSDGSTGEFRHEIKLTIYP